MAATTSPVTPEQTAQVPPTAAVPFDFSQPPVIEGFSPLPRIREETFKEKFLRKTKENPFVPIGQLHKPAGQSVRVSDTTKPTLASLSYW